MFDPKILQQLATNHKTALKKLAEIEDRLNARFSGMEEPVRALILAVASGEPLLFIGPPGTAKSRLIRAFCGQLGLVDENDLSIPHEEYFEYLLTPFTEPGELFGFYNITENEQNGRKQLDLKRQKGNTMQEASLVYLDEVFNASSAILNSILAVLNERIFHDRGERTPVLTKALFAATNHPPQTPELKAVFDRFVLRCRVDNVDAKPETIRNLLNAGWVETYGVRPSPPDHFRTLLAEMEAFRKTISAWTNARRLVPQTNSQFYNHLAQRVDHIRRFELSEMSNRRLVKVAYLMLIHCVYEAVREEKPLSELVIGRAELNLIPRFFLDNIEDEAAIWKLER